MTHLLLFNEEARVCKHEKGTTNVSCDRVAGSRGKNGHAKINTCLGRRLLSRVDCVAPVGKTKHNKDDVSKQNL